VRLGFGFSAGLFDYVLNFNKATRPLMLVPIGLAYFALYYGLFRFVIVRLNLKTPGREEGLVAAEAAVPGAVPADRALAYIRALGGAANIVSLDACTTRLRLVMADQSAVDAEALKRLGVRGMIRPSATALQVVVGAEADQVAGEMKAALRAASAAAATGPAGAGAGVAASAAGPTPAAPAAALTATAVPATAPPTAAVPIPTLLSLLTALGGRANVRAVETASTRLRINIADPSAVNESAIVSLGLRGVALAAPNWLHVIVGPEAAAAGASLRQLL
jgi:PTS system N-acetylglucosamine-specific IIC component